MTEANESGTLTDMPHRSVLGIMPMSIANMKQNRVSIPLEEIYAMGFTNADAVIDIGGKLRCSKCGHKGATTQPDWTTRKDVSGASQHYSSPT